jgi:photoactive yellow protein
MPFEFEAAGILAALEAASEEALDAAPFGIVRMGGDRRVLFYNRYESRLSGLSPGSVKGRNFFEDVAPCTNNFLVAQKFIDFVELDEVLDYVFTFRMRPTNVRLRLLKSEASAHEYLLVQSRS